VLIVFSGLSGVGKTTIARSLASSLGAVHLRIDSIEQALRRSGVRVEAEGYEIAYAIADDNLRTGRTVIADCVNPWPLTRARWRAVAGRAGVRATEVEIVCSDTAEHRRRVSVRVADIDGHILPTWEEVIGRDYRPWDTRRLVIDTSRVDVDGAVRQITAAITP
jgi:predicted kinase